VDKTLRRNPAPCGAGSRKAVVSAASTIVHSAVYPHVLPADRACDSMPPLSLA
jgi:hypothetical protein